MTDERLSYDWESLVSLLPPDARGDPESFNEALNAIYMKAVEAQIDEVSAPDARVTRRQLKALDRAFNKLGRPARQILEAQMRDCLGGAWTNMLDTAPYREIGQVLGLSIFRAALSSPRKPIGPRGIGAMARQALIGLVGYYCEATGQGSPYRDNGQWRRLEAVEFAAAIMSVWNLRRKSDTPASLAGIWLNVSCHLSSRSNLDRDKGA